MKKLPDYYGTEEVKKIIENMPASEFRQRVLRLMCLLLKIKKIKYASRGVKITTKKNSRDCRYEGLCIKP